MRWHRIREIIRKEFRQVLREPRMRVVLFFPPLIQTILFGFAVNLDVENCLLAWMDLDRTPASRELRAAFEGSRRFVFVAQPDSETQVRDLLDRGDAQVLVRVPAGFARDLARGDTAAVQILVDGTNSNTASIIAGYAAQIVSGYSARVMVEQQQARLVARSMVLGGPVPLSLPGIEPRSRVWFNPELRSRNYFVPGVVVNIITLVTLILTALAIVREKEIGTMEQLMVTPIRPLELMLGKTLPFALAGLFDVILITVAALLVFNIPFRGSVLLLLACACIFLLTTVGAGLFLSPISRTQQQAVMASFFFFLPAFMLSGFTFPIRNMPLAFQYLSYLDPMRYFITIVRGIFLKGVGAAVLWPQMLILLAYGVTVLTFSALRFHKRLD